MAISSHLLSTGTESVDANDDFRKGNFLFLHLSAADQMGHTKKPGSKEYLSMVRHLDKNIARIIDIFEQHPEISQDAAFIFTADHGMTDWGSHGAGSAHETITPLIVWGKHIPRPVSPFKFVDLSPTTKSSSRIDIRQADLCPLIACLLGIPIPAHSIGELPLEFLDLDPSLKVGLIRENALHALKQLHIKYEERKASHYHMFFREFSKFSKNTIQSMLEKAALQTANSDISADY
nr:gpi ethanolamine phosphate transferase 1 [Hymenolepis microstoma]